MLGFASDYDNTLYMHRLLSHGISRSDRRIIKKFKNEGNLFGLCTGRPYKGFRGDRNLVKIHPDFYIASTGAHIIGFDGKVLFEKCIPFELMKTVIETENQNAWHSIEMDGDFYVLGDKGHSFAPRLSAIEQAKGHSIHEFSFHLPTERLAEIMTQRINKTYGSEITAFRNVNNIDVVTAGCSKGEGVRFIKEYYNIDLMGGMGDSVNDLPLVEAADIGFTFKRAPQELKDAADYIEKSVGAAIRKMNK